MSLASAIFVAAMNGDTLLPEITESLNYKHWVSIDDLRRCIICASYHGKIWLIAETPEIKPPVHLNCRCVIELMEAITAGTATINGVNGADRTLKYKDLLQKFTANRLFK